MGKSNKVFRFIARNRQSLGIIGLLLLLAVLLAVVAYDISVMTYETPRGAMLPVMCYNCGYKEVRRIKDIRDPSYKCSQCGGKIGKLWKCTDCHYEFPHIRDGAVTKSMNKYEAFEMIRIQSKCPNCGSPKTIPMPASYLQK